MSESPVESPAESLKGQTIQLTSDGKLTKTILKEGTGRFPKDGDRIRCHFIGRLHDTKVEYSNTYKDSRPFKFVVGHVDFEAWTLGAKTMREGEKALFIVGPEYAYGEKGHEPEIPPDATIEIEAELLEILETFENPDDAAKRADELCTIASNDFRSGQIETAIQKYDDILSFLEDYKNSNVTLIRTKIQRNLSVCYAKQKQWEKSLLYANEVLNKVPSDLKALYWKGLAALELRKIDIADEAISQGLKTNGKANFLPLNARLLELKKEEQTRQDQTFAAMMGKN